LKYCWTRRWCSASSREFQYTWAGQGNPIGADGCLQAGQVSVHMHLPDYMFSLLTQVAGWNVCFACKWGCHDVFTQFVGGGTCEKSRRKRAPCWTTSVSVVGSPASNSMLNTRNSFSMEPTCSSGVATGCNCMDGQRVRKTTRVTSAKSPEHILA
jgi:hypothetical protein